jgi:predicted GNAT family N-acyltransferase
LRAFHVTCGIQADQDTNIDMSEQELHWQSLDFDALDSHQLYRILHLRQQVFIVEQNCIYQDLDNLDQLSLHLCANRGEDLLGFETVTEPYDEDGIAHIKMLLRNET